MHVVSKKVAIVASICILLILPLSEEIRAALSAATVIRCEGSVLADGGFYVRPFGFRIADMMADLLRPDFDDRSYSTSWQQALDDLAEASPNGEITHVQMRIWWDLSDDFITPQLWSLDGAQNPIMQDENWKRWYFGYIAPEDPPLAYGPCALERIRAKGFKYELAISGAWEGDVVKPGGTNTPVGAWGARESDYPSWIEAGGGDQFLENYKNNVLLPVANFVKDYLQDGDIFSLSFEMTYPTADFTWSHNAKWTAIVAEIRQVFIDAGKSGVIIGSHECSWYDDFGLGHDSVKIINSSAPLGSSYEGISGATWLKTLDLVIISWWNPVILASEVPSVWNDSHISLVVEAWYHNKQEPKVGTGYSGVPAVFDRDYVQDLRVFSQLMGVKVLLNTGYENRHGMIAQNPRRSGLYTPDSQEQRIAWIGQIRALTDPDRSNYTSWLAGQDFERYVRDKAVYPDRMDASWRNAPAETAIIEEIRAIVGLP